MSVISILLPLLRIFGYFVFMQDATDKYIASLCNIAKITSRIGMHQFRGTDLGFLAANPVQKEKEMCEVMDKRKSVCQRKRNYRWKSISPSFQHGPDSDLFSSMPRNTTCNKTV